MRDLTKSQSELFGFIRGELTLNGLAPTVQEIQREFGFGSPNAVQTHLNALEKKGFIRRLERQARGLRLTNNGRKRGRKPLSTSRISPMDSGRIYTSSQVAEQGFGPSSHESDANGRTSVANDVQLTPGFSTQTVSLSDTMMPPKIGKILVIDDEDDIRYVVATRLERAGYATVVAADGREGLRRFYNDRPDLVVLDIGMPEMDGWQVLERIREVSDLPVLMLTAAAQERDKLRGLRGGADDYITKPFSGEEFLARVEAALRRATASSEWDDHRQANGYDDTVQVAARKITERVNKDQEFPAPSLSSTMFDSEVTFHAKHAISTEFYGETHLHLWKMLTRVYLTDDLAGPAGELQRIYVRRLLRELADDIEGTLLNQLDSFTVLEPTPERIVTWLGFKAKQELEMVGVQLSCIALQDLGVTGPGGITQEGKHPMLKIDFQGPGSGVPQIYEVRISGSPIEKQTQLDTLTERESIEDSERPPYDIPFPDAVVSAGGEVETLNNTVASENTRAVIGDSGIAPPVQQSEMGIDVFFNAKHITSNEFDGEIHAHSWRLRAVVLVANDRDDPTVGFEQIRDGLQDVVDEVEGVVLNGIDPFQTVEPTPERVVAWLSLKIRNKLTTLGVQLRSTTLWDHPTQYVTTWEEVALRAA